MIKKIFAILLSLGLCAGVFYQDSDAAALNRHPKAIKRARMHAGEVMAYQQNDTYFSLDEVSALDIEKLLVDSGFEAAYAITGDEAHYYYESADVPADLAMIISDRVTINQSDLDALKNVSKVGFYEVRGTYKNQDVIDAGYAGTFEFILNISVYDKDYSVYDSDQSDSAVAVLHAHNFELPIADAKTFDANAAKANAESQFKAWDAAVAGGDFAGGRLDPGKDLASITKVNDSQLNAIKNAKVGGAFPLTYSLTYYDGKTLTRTVTVFVSDDNTVIDRDKNLVIFANDFEMEIEKAKVATLADVKPLVDPRVYEYTTGILQDDNYITIDVQALNDKANSIDVNAKAFQIAKIKVNYSNSGKSIETQVDGKITYTANNDGGSDENIETPPKKDKPKPKPVPSTGQNPLFIMVVLMLGVSAVGMKFRLKA